MLIHTYKSTLAVFLVRRPCTAAALGWKGPDPRHTSLAEVQERKQERDTKQSKEMQLNKGVGGQGHKNEQESWLL